MASDEEVDSLYGLPLAEFTSARNELAARLKKAGRREEADGVKALAKPAVSAWAINQLARRKPDSVRRLLEAGSRLAEAQASLLKGGDQAEFQAATRAERDTVADLVREAAVILGASASAPSKPLLDRIESTLHAAAVEEDSRVLLEQGRLTGDVEPAGFGPLAAFAPAAIPSRPKEAPHSPARPPVEVSPPEPARPASKPQPDRQVLEKLERARTEAQAQRQEAERLQDDAALAARRAAEARRAANEAQRAAEAAEAEASGARNAAAEAATRAAAAERGYQEAREAAGL